jgi:uncharacterized protein
MIRRMNDVAVFLVVALGGAWIAAAPLWIGGVQLSSALATALALLMMVTPSLAVLAVWRSRHRDVDRRAWAQRTGLTLGPQRRRTLALTAVAWLGTPLLVALAIACSALLGVLSVDVDGLSLFREQLDATGVDPRALPEPRVVAAAQIAAALLVAPAINAIPAFGEEWGWRGWLLPRLIGLGTWPALLLSGVIWGIWHAPLTLLGYNYPALGAWAAPMFVGFCVLGGVVIGWLRLYSGSVWPAAVAHGALNATGGTIVLIGDAAAPPNLAVAGITGLVGWALLALLGVVLVGRWPIPRTA